MIRRDPPQGRTTTWTSVVIGRDDEPASAKFRKSGERIQRAFTLPAPRGYLLPQSHAIVELMRPWSSVPRLLLALAFFGLVLGPVAASATAPAMTMQTMAPMPDGMPCCPDNPTSGADCAKDCPIAVLCMSGFVSAPIPQMPMHFVRLLAGDELVDGRDSVLSSLIGEPPPRPPKA